MGYFIEFIAFIRVYFDKLVDKIFGLFLDNTRQPLKDITDPLLMESASSLAQKIREGKLKSYDLVQTCIARIEDVNPVINAVVDKRFTKALEVAKEIDKNIEDGVYSEQDFKKMPFLGVPFTTKESTACKGLKWSFGLVCRKYCIAPEDAEVVRLMKEAGGILIGL